MCQTLVLGIYFQLNHLVRGHRHHQSVAQSTETLNSQNVRKFAESNVLPVGQRP